MGLTYFSQKNYSAAAACFRKATELKPDFALAYYNLAHSLKEQGDEAGAIAAFRTALSCQADYVAAHYNLATLLVKKSQWDEALVHLRHAVQLKPADARVRTLLEQVQKKVEVEKPRS